MHFMKFVLVLGLIMVPYPTDASDNAKIVRAWADRLGDELWSLTRSLTKMDEIRNKYTEPGMNVSVKKKNGTSILNSALRSVSRMLKSKINAVKCIHATAERLAREFNYTLTKDSKLPFQYCSAKYSPYNDDNRDLEDFPEFARNNSHYLEMKLEKDSHFYDISVTTDTSCVHVPTNIYYRDNDTLNAILWSKDLNEIFIRNYKSDPSLSWQYFGSSRGILRFYPGMPWNIKASADTYDCRVKSWYIEAATCSKDVIILFDVSGSMTGFKNYVARRTLETLLFTLSNNDFVNVYHFKNETKEAVPCFENLVQATIENLNTFKDALEPLNNGKDPKVPLEGYANLTVAYIKAFTKLKQRRLEQNCSVTSTQGCNQLLMLITDYVPANLTEVFEEHNREVVDNKTYIPVRVFTYLIGKEVTNVREIQWMACLNRGYYVHIHSVEEVQQQALKYINVIARPMILEGEEPPPTWTHANIDETRTTKWDVSSHILKPDEDKLVTSVGIPAFDYKYNEENNDAMLLGVAGTDVPIDNIAKLAQPNQLGVNGYSFIVSNNGYLLLHPLLITSINGVLQENYNSIDFVEVEQVDDGLSSRQLGKEITDLRSKMVSGEEGIMEDIHVLFHYDHMRRIARVKHDYIFRNLEGTPFSMGISLPDGYGDTEIEVGKDIALEIRHQKLMGVNITDYFRNNFRVHPDWVYCKYHYLEKHERENAELELWDFLILMGEENWVWKEQYEDTGMDDKNFTVETHCGNATTQLGQNDYYCNKDLVNQLIFDAKLTTPYFKNWTASERDREMAENYNVSVRFIATASGLARWHYINNDNKNEVVNDDGTRHKSYHGKVFGDVYDKAIEETWYKAAVLQHMISKESLVVATRLPVLDKTIKNARPVEDEDGDITLTASYAVFPRENGEESPASVVGFQYSYKSFFRRFLEITNNSSMLTCEEGIYDCYVIDSSGYIILSSSKSDVGKFFGVEEPWVLQNLIEKKIFHHVEVYNYQALCFPSDLQAQKSGGFSLSTPFDVMKSVFKWLIMELVILLAEVFNNAEAVSIVNEDYIDLLEGHTEKPATTPTPPKEDAEKTRENNTEKLFSCDHCIHLYILNQSYFLNEKRLDPVVYENKTGDCYPQYWAAHVSKTNLLLVVTLSNWMPSKENCEKPADTTPKPTPESTESSQPCHKLKLGALSRRRLEGCYTCHEGEKNITACGRGSFLKPHSFFVIVTVFLLIPAKFLD